MSFRRGKKRSLKQIPPPPFQKKSKRKLVLFQPTNNSSLSSTIEVKQRRYKIEVPLDSLFPRAFSAAFQLLGWKWNRLPTYCKYNTYSTFQLTARLGSQVCSMHLHSISWKGNPFFLDPPKESPRCQ